MINGILPSSMYTPPVVATTSNIPAMEMVALGTSAYIATGQAARCVENFAQVSAHSVSFWQDNVDAGATAMTEMLEPMGDTLHQSLCYYGDSLANLPHAIATADPMYLLGLASMGLWWIIIRRYERGQIRSPLLNSIFRRIFPGIGPYDRL